MAHPPSDPVNPPVKLLNLAITYSESPNAFDSTKTDISLGFQRVNAATGRQEFAVPAIVWNELGSADLALMRATISDRQAQAVAEATKLGLPAPANMGGGNYQWSGITADQADDIQEHTLNHSALGAQSLLQLSRGKRKHGH